MEIEPITFLMRNQALIHYFLMKNTALIHYSLFL